MENISFPQPFLINCFTVHLLSKLCGVALDTQRWPSCRFVRRLFLLYRRHYGKLKNKYREKRFHNICRGESWPSRGRTLVKMQCPLRSWTYCRVRHLTKIPPKREANQFCRRDDHWSSAEWRAFPISKAWDRNTTPLPCGRAMLVPTEDRGFGLHKPSPRGGACAHLSDLRKGSAYKSLPLGGKVGNLLKANWSDEGLS